MLTDLMCHRGCEAKTTVFLERLEVLGPFII